MQALESKSSPNVCALLGYLLSGSGKERLDFDNFQDAFDCGHAIRDTLEKGGIADKVSVSIGATIVRVEVLDPTLSIDL